VFNPKLGKKLFFWNLHPNWLYGPPSLLCDGYLLYSSKCLDSEHQEQPYFTEVLTLESEDAPSGFILILTYPLGETLNWLLETAAFCAARFVGLSSSSALPVAYRDT
jgi:hypothetical protein